MNNIKNHSNQITHKINTIQNKIIQINTIQIKIIQNDNLF